MGENVVEKGDCGREWIGLEGGEKYVEDKPDKICAKCKCVEANDRKFVSKMKRRAKQDGLSKVEERKLPCAR